MCNAKKQSFWSTSLGTTLAIFFATFFFFVLLGAF